MLDFPHLGGALSPEGSVKDTPTLSIYFWTAYTQNMLPFSSSISVALAVDIGNSILYLCENFRTLAENATTMTSRLRNVWGPTMKIMVCI